MMILTAAIIQRRHGKIIPTRSTTLYRGVHQNGPGKAAVSSSFSLCDDSRVESLALSSSSSWPVWHAVPAVCRAKWQQAGYHHQFIIMSLSAYRLHVSTVVTIIVVIIIIMKSELFGGRTKVSWLPVTYWSLETFRPTRGKDARPILIRDRA